MIGLALALTVLAGPLLRAPSWAALVGFVVGLALGWDVEIEFAIPPKFGKAQRFQMHSGLRLFDGRRSLLQLPVAHRGGDCFGFAFEDWGDGNIMLRTEQCWHQR